jgi:hypothetical protein
VTSAEAHARDLAQEDEAHARQYHVMLDDDAARVIRSQRPYTLDTEAPALKTQKRLRRVTRDLERHQPQAEVAPGRVKLVTVDDPRGLWDGISRISADWPALLGMAQDAGRYALTLELPQIGVIKGHALVDPDLPTWTIQTAERNITREVMPVGETAVITLEAMHAATPETDIQSVLNLWPIMAAIVEDAASAKREEMQRIMAGIEADETPASYHGILPAHYRCNPASFSAYLGTYRTHLSAAAEALHAPMSKAIRLYLTAATPAGVILHAPYALLDEERASVIVPDSQYTQIAASLGGADQDDAIMIAADRDGHLVLWRNPNAPGEYAVLRQSPRGRQMERYDMSAADLGKVRKAKIVEERQYYVQTDNRQLANMAATARERKNSIGATCNLLMLAAYNKGTVTMPVSLEEVIDNANKGGKLDAAAILEWANKRTAAAFSNPKVRAPYHMSAKYRPCLWHMYASQTKHAGGYTPAGAPIFTEAQKRMINARIARHFTTRQQDDAAMPQTQPSVWLHRQLVALKAEYTAWQKRQSSRSLYTSAHAITEESAATLAQGHALHHPFSAAIAASHDPGRWSQAASDLLHTIQEQQLDEVTAIESLLLATEARHNAGRVYPQAITAGGMLDLSKQALAHTAHLTPGEASELIAAKDKASKTGNRDKARESIARLTGRPATLYNGRLTIELDNGQRHTIEGLSHPPTPKTRCTIARMTLNAADTLVIGLKRQQ